MTLDTDREAALQLMQEYVSNKNLRKHMLAVEAVMKAYAKIFNKDTRWWGNIGLLHDFDYEKYPSLNDHPFKGAGILAEKGYSEEFIKTVLAHAPHTKEPRDTTVKKTIFAVDELTGLIVAVALVMPDKKLVQVTVPSVIKKLHNKSFARQVNREEIYQGAKELAIPLEQHIHTVIQSLQPIANSLNL